MRKLLIANRSEIAARIIRTAREMDIGTVAVFSDADADAGFVADADESVHLPGNSPTDTYLRGDLIIAAAQHTGADAIHPGYGFLSENADFATACAAAGLIFVGPPPSAIEAMGSKITAKELMAAAGVPVLPGLTVVDGEDIDTARASEIGFPILVKAAYGGGGRGMRVVRESGELADAVRSAQREAKSAFGNGTVFLERFVDSPRHIEVQIFGDNDGTVVHLFERECSIQRRYQKIIEESPSPAVDETLRAKLGDAAIAAGKAIGYTGAGTVEFVLGADGGFFFLEVNTRLQVEHPVTEMVTGLDLVRLQLLVAEGQPLPDEAVNPVINGHAIEARLYAEDPLAGYAPVIGTVHQFQVPSGVRVDAGISSGSVVGVHYDPMLAKVIAHGATRADAARRLARALAETRLHGVVTNRELLVAILRESEFRSGDIDTGYLDRHPPAQLCPPPSDTTTGLHALAAALAGQSARRHQATVQTGIPSGWRNVPSSQQHIAYTAGEPSLEVDYRITTNAVEATVNGTELGPVLARSISQERVDLQVDGIRRTVLVHTVDDVSYVDSSLGSSTLRETPRFPDPEARSVPGSLLAPMPGTVVRIEVEPGQSVAKGATVVVLEAMKMEHSIKAPHDGNVEEINVTTGAAVDTGTVLAVVAEATP